MPIAGAVVTPYDRGLDEAVKSRLNELPGVEVQAIGPKGLAIVLDREIDGLKAVSREIQNWDEVLSFQVAYINWEDPRDQGSDDGQFL